jgi:glycerophosphoryl diester phosphodiesterase
MLIIAHRGASGYAPENTMAAFRLAVEMGAKAIELDIHQTRDHELVVIHDEDLRRVARRKARIRDLTREQLMEFDIGSWFDPCFSAERVPTLADVFELTAGKAELHIEIKKGSRMYPGIEERLVDMIQRRDAWKTTLVSSFDHPALYSTRSLDARVRIGYLLGLTGMKTAYREMEQLRAESLNMSARQAEAKKVRECRERGLKTLVYTVNTRKELARLAKLGIDGVFTNFPELTI